MKSSYVALAVLVAVARAQIPNIPQCALPCITNVLLNNNSCSSLTDIACYCARTELISQIQPCVERECTPAETDSLVAGVQDTCAEVGVPVDVPGAEASSSPDAAATTEVPYETSTASPTLEEYAPAETTDAPETPTGTVEIQTDPAITTPTETVDTETETETETQTETPTDTEVTASPTEETTTETAVIIPSSVTLVTSPIPTGYAQPTAGITSNTTGATGTPAPFTGAANKLALSINGLVALFIAVVFAV